jgi:hypothetical protein
MADQRNKRGLVLLLIGIALAAFGLFEIYTPIHRVFVFAQFVRHKQTSVGIFVSLRTLIHFAIFAIPFVVGVSLIVVALRRRRRS